MFGRVFGRPDDVIYLALATPRCTYRLPGSVGNEGGFGERKTSGIGGNMLAETLDTSVSPVSEKKIFLIMKSVLTFREIERVEVAKCNCSERV